MPRALAILPAASTQASPPMPVISVKAPCPVISSVECWLPSLVEHPDMGQARARMRGRHIVQFHVDAVTRGLGAIRDDG